MMVISGVMTSVQLNPDSGLGQEIMRYFKNLKVLKAGFSCMVVTASAW
jgi:hypothetical protein